MESTGVAPGLFYMSGYAHLIRALRSFRGNHRMRDPATLFKCEICPSIHSMPLRVRQRRFIGADATGDPLLVMAAEAGLAPLVSQSRMVMSGMSADRESAAAAAVSAVLAGDAIDAPVGYAQIGFASAWDERLGRSTVREFGFKGAMSAEGVFSASLSCGSALGPAVDSLLRSEDPQFFSGRRDRRLGVAVVRRCPCGPRRELGPAQVCRRRCCDRSRTRLVQRSRPSRRRRGRHSVVGTTHLERRLFECCGSGTRCRLDSSGAGPPTILPSGVRTPGIWPGV